MTHAAAPARVPRLDSCYDMEGYYYPAEEERDVPLSTAALKLIVYLYSALRALYAGRNDVLVGADQFIYYAPRDRTRKIAPDVYVFLGRPPLPLRPVIRTWEEGASPSFVVE